MTGILVFVTHRTPSPWSLVAKLRTELFEAWRAADAEPDTERRVRMKIHAFVEGMKSAWKQA